MFYSYFCLQRYNKIMRKPSFQLFFSWQGINYSAKKVALKGQKLLVFKAFALTIIFALGKIKR